MSVKTCLLNNTAAGVTLFIEGNSTAGASCYGNEVPNWEVLEGNASCREYQGGGLLDCATDSAVLLWECPSATLLTASCSGYCGVMPIPETYLFYNGEAVDPEYRGGGAIGGSSLGVGVSGSDCVDNDFVDWFNSRGYDHEVLSETVDSGFRNRSSSTECQQRRASCSRTTIPTSLGMRNRGCALETFLSCVLIYLFRR